MTVAGTFITFEGGDGSVRPALPLVERRELPLERGVRRVEVHEGFEGADHPARVAEPLVDPEHPRPHNAALAHLVEHPLVGGEGFLVAIGLLLDARERRERPDVAGGQLQQVLVGRHRGFDLTGDELEAGEVAVRALLLRADLDGAGGEEQRRGEVALGFVCLCEGGEEGSFARPEFADRQRAYQAKLRLRDIYTPQIVVDGRRQVSGARPPEVRAAVDEEAARRVWPPEVQFTGDGTRVAVGSGRSPEGGADVWLVRYAPGPEAVEVRGGDNRGQTVRHVNVVREIVRLGDWSGRPSLFDMPAADDAGLSAVVLVQSRSDGRIVAAATPGAS